MKMNMPILLCAATVLLSGCKGAVRDSTSDVQALKDNEVQWNADFASKDVARIAAHYADDAVFLVSGEKPTFGKDAITAEFKGMTSDPAFSLQLHTDKVVVAESGDLGFTQGTYSLTITNPADKSVITMSVRTSPCIERQVMAHGRQSQMCRFPACRQGYLRRSNGTRRLAALHLS